VEITQFWIDFLRPQVDVIVIASHLGLRGEKRMTRGDEIDDEGDCPEGDCAPASICPMIERLVGDEQLIRYTTGIDVVLGGHLHIVLDPPEVIEDCDPHPDCCDSEHGKQIVERLHELGCYCYPDGHAKYDPDCIALKRKVPLVHSGAFLKYIGQVDAVFHHPDPPRTPAVNCAANPNDPECKQYNQRRLQYQLNNWELKAFRHILHPVDDRINEAEFDPEVQQVLQPYTLEMNRAIQLGRYIAFAPQSIRRFSRGYGDSQLGDVVAEAMQRRNRVEAQFGLTNTLGIRADIQPGPVTIEMMYNIFPFENTIVTMTLSGREVINLADYVALRSARRGCQSQAQVAGITMVMNCNEPVHNPYGERASRITIGGSRLTDPARYGFEPGVGPYCQYDGLGACTLAEDQACVDLARCAGEIEGSCPSPAPVQPDPPCCDWRLEPARPCPAGNTYGDGTCCPMGELCTPLGCGTPVSPYTSYKAAVNDYISKGGSGFTVLEHNTTQFNTGISLRDAVIDYLFTTYPPCGTNPVYYDLCVENLGEALQNDCSYIQDATRRADCEARALNRAGSMCEDLPCVTVQADGRLEQIYPTK
jgi:5'-nucleotidase